MSMCNTIKYTLFSTFIFLFLASCHLRPKNDRAKASTLQKIIINYPNLTRAQQLISTDKKEDFFSRVNALDMSIQMQNNPDVSTSKNYLKDYKKYLKEEVLIPSDQDREKVNNSFDTITNYLKRLSIKTDIDTIHIIKVSGKAYGKEAFYTRENCIIIPETQFEMTSTGFVNVMLHELFHIISRYDEQIKSKAYALIGFEKINPVEIKNKAIKDRVLLNPDGLSNAYAIELSDGNGNSIKAVPVIYSKQNRYQQFIPDFFNYIQFDLFQIENAAGAVPYIEDSDDKIEPIEKAYYDDFFKKIADNTQYIIHPDEIMADNFMIMVNAYIDNNFESFSEEGKALLDKLHHIFISKDQ